ncbi:hypothetical protein SCHPADRAFT_613055 [Schizopora paradoxa]|uniref:Uncharacterized protein n=1 Tax=Schizopora paradoxa TaxID=27342 RepID=A0A0H2RFJ2_9AGAM|nr:hypothetical protein SCHPADRAFT_613055 [Schizopora paradoxa]
MQEPAARNSRTMSSFCGASSRRTRDVRTNEMDRHANTVRTETPTATTFARRQYDPITLRGYIESKEERQRCERVRKAVVGGKGDHPKLATVLLAHVKYVLHHRTQVSIVVNATTKDSRHRLLITRSRTSNDANSTFIHTPRRTHGHAATPLTGRRYDLTS